MWRGKEAGATTSWKAVPSASCRMEGRKAGETGISLLGTTGTLHLPRSSGGLSLEQVETRHARAVARYCDTSGKAPRLCPDDRDGNSEPDRDLAPLRLRGAARPAPARAARVRVPDGPRPDPGDAGRRGRC